MARKIFVSYKYADENVPDLDMFEISQTLLGTYRTPRRTRVRDYVDKLQDLIGRENINIGEKDGESLADFANSTIETSLKDKIFHSSLTIVMISQGMVSPTEIQKDQWIPWEISYSLRTIQRENSTSRMNGVLGVVLPDRNGSYDWYYTENAACNCFTHHYNKVFDILGNNMFNLKQPTIRDCNGLKVHEGEFSFIKTVRWNSFMYGNNSNAYIETAIQIRDNKEKYDITVNLS